MIQRFLQSNSKRRCGKCGTILFKKNKIVTLNDDDLDKYITDRRKLEKEIRDDELSIKNEKLKEIKLKKEIYL